MLGRLVAWSLRRRLIVLLATIGIIAWGVDSYRKLPIDAFPDVSPMQVLVAMQAPGLPPEELEAQVTNPAEIAMKGIPNLVGIRSITRYAVALMTFEFAPGTDIYWARTQVDQRLDDLEEQLPDGVKGGLAPVVTPLGEMLMFTLTGGGLSPQQRRSILDWTIRPQLRGLPGIADVNTLGGFVRTYEVAPNPSAMAARGITTAMLAEALQQNNRNDGAGRVRDGEEALLVRAEGRIRTMDDIRAIVVAAHPTGVVRISDVADVRFGALARNGVVTTNGESEAVWAIVLGLRGANAKTVVNNAKAKLEQIQKTLPEGVTVDIFYDRNELIEKAVWTVQKVLLEAIALVVVLLILFLGNLRAALVVSLTLPLAVLSTFIVMRLTGISANIMSLGGLAIAIGLLVDCSVVVVENTAHHFAHAHGRTDFRTRMRMTGEAVREVAVPLVSGVVIIVTVFLPLLSLQGLEGRLFAPVALTITFALCAALLLSLTVVPALAATLLKQGGGTRDPWLVRLLHRGYDPFLGWAMKKPLAVGAVAVAGLVLAGFLFTRIGSTFMPVMDEGTPVVTLRKHPTIGVDAAAATDLMIQRQIMAAVPEVRGIMGRAGADELGIDPVGLNDSDLFLDIKPREEWRQPKNRNFVVNEVRKVLDHIPGISYAINQPIDMRVQEMIIGARGDVVIKVFGYSIDELNRIAGEVEKAVRGIAGASDIFALRNEGMKYLKVEIDRFAAGRLGISVRDVQQALRVWVDGRDLGIVLEQERRIPLVLRGEGSLRRSATDLERVILALPGGRTVALSQVAHVSEEEGPIQVIREGTQRYATVLANVRGRDLVGFVAEAQAAVASAVQVPGEYRLEWGGQFENQQRASARLAVVVPIALALIFLLLYFTFNSVREALLVFCNVPFAAIGGVIALYLSGEFLSVPASVGFIALVGIAVLNGVVLISYINRLIAENGMSLHEAVREGARRRMTPVVLTATIAAFGLVPFLFAEGPGSEIQRPLAIVVIGGLVTATVLTLVLLPILYDRFALSRAEAEAEAEAHPAPAQTPAPKAHPAARPAAAE
ncbi:efflux RND transporter permease subunit [Dankookia rubra]|uniref:Efflux RND transporter permease subunit n=1 Tax=Dankookia rubra TaxID=1442381 RepID=A0A4R5Q680_9PROT|nr:CusA/CzcA family heavy metal efflux RND transporter [Dankookia rubra]TDH58374.1 efflux RND transporter permease subunit [Dankookia rubra]